MKALIVLGILALATEAAADRKVYDVKAVAPDNHILSCGATRRMLKDRHIITVDDDTRFYVDGFRWESWWKDDPIAETISFHTTDASGKPQSTYLVMDLSLDDRVLIGTYILYGRTRSGKECSDAVQIVGTRR